MILTTSITNYRLRRKHTELALSPRRHPSSSRRTRTRRSPPNLSYFRSTPLNRCGRFPRSASRHRKTTHCHRARYCISPCQRRSGKQYFVRRRNGFDRSCWNERVLMVSDCSRGAMTGGIGHFCSTISSQVPLGPVAPLRLPLGYAYVPACVLVHFLFFFSFLFTPVPHSLLVLAAFVFPLYRS